MTADPVNVVGVKHATALLLAGRVLDEYFVKVGHVAALRRLAASHPGLEVVVASDEINGPARGDDENLFARVAIGFVIRAVTCDEDPLGPISLAELHAGLTRTGEIGELFWKSAAKLLGHAAPPFDPASRRAALASPEVHANVVRAAAGVAFDGPDLASVVDGVYLLATGPLAHAALARGTVGTLPEDDTGDGIDGWVYGQKSGQDPAERGVRGERIGIADILGLGSYQLDLDELAAATGDLYLIARYD